MNCGRTRDERDCVFCTYHTTELTLKGIHNCCEGCAKPIKAAIEKVEGVTSEDVKAKETTITVKGSFDLLKLYKALYDAGYHATIDTKAKK